jgi:hypothetical protein
MEWAIAVFVGLSVAIGLAAWRTLTLFHVSIRHGDVLVVYGRIPGPLLTELRDIARIAKIEHGTIKAVKDGGEASIVCVGLDESSAQRVRNVCGPYPIAKLRHARAIVDPTLGQRLGIAWLAWREKRYRKH